MTRQQIDRRRAYPPAFKTKAREYLKAHPFCMYCSAMGRTTPSTLVDHIKPVTKGGSMMDKANWAACCRGCHDGWVKSLERGGKLKPFVGPDGLPVASPLLDRAVQAKASETELKVWEHLRAWT